MKSALITALRLTTNTTPYSCAPPYQTTLSDCN
ncbi:hypothetical protein T4D_4720 [Trichinella pseudospiralis]|uniref:Uncharacterized protein n=1 Tax=Trichinella pseudospiralis TaxID=6337 RepID=A0A0V1F233_TRIPS|nr:hypothetical protein T4D_12298 [Trichinella pseudospiralis]KRY80242.1 hypothetical protein T4D_4720 [Trichinella pseudospiralis]